MNDTILNILLWSLIICGVVFIVCLWAIALGKSAKDGDDAHLRAFAKTMKEENSVPKYDATETTITSGCPVENNK